MTAHAHVIPLHDGWTVEETTRWLSQGLVLPDKEPELGWVTLLCDEGQCPVCPNLGAFDGGDEQ